MSKRFTVTLDDEAAALLPRLAGGARKQGDFLSRLIHAAANAPAGPTPSDFEALQLEVKGLVSELHKVNARLLTLESRDE